MNRSAARFCAARGLRGIRMLKLTHRKRLLVLLWLVLQPWLMPQLGLAADAAAKESAFGVYQGYSPVLYSDQIKTSFYLPMLDGVRLAVYLYRTANGEHAGDGKFPVIWLNTYVRKWVSLAS